MVELIPITAWMLFWMRDSQKAYINNVRMDDLFSVVGGRLRPRASEGRGTVAEYLHSKCKVPYDREVSARHVEMELQEGAVYRRFTRGKFVLWFLVEFCRSVRQNATTLFVSCDKVPAINVTVSSSNAMVVVGNRGRLPESLRVFLRETYCTYIEQLRSAQDSECKAKGTE